VPESACIVTRKKKQKMYFQKFGMRIVHRRENMGCQEPDRWILCFGITEQAFGSTDIDSMAGEKRAKMRSPASEICIGGLDSHIFIGNSAEAKFHVEHPFLDLSDIG